ncbi:hypothetical protein RRG08_040932 [Elysia crispata]|uniref:Uncharacterized protein n=1 Tax=Elysia crispata TaxID=231223 RepID=A0AAE1CKA6_9GAST|nr:hypothetical protein RRG08_040932 [Elysia crispata]
MSEIAQKFYKKEFPPEATLVDDVKKDMALHQGIAQLCGSSSRLQWWKLDASSEARVIFCGPGLESDPPYFGIRPEKHGLVGGLFASLIIGSDTMLIALFEAVRSRLAFRLSLRTTDLRVQQLLFIDLTVLLGAWLAGVKRLSWIFTPRPDGAKGINIGSSV